MSRADRLSVEEFFRTRRLLILDFDGPVTRLLPDPRHIELADAVKRLLRNHGAVLPPTVTAAIDHVQVLRYAAQALPSLLPDVEELCSAAELQAAHTATPAAGAIELLDLRRRQHHPVAIVTNNDARVVGRFAQRHGIDLSGCTVHGRGPGHADRLKPSPWMLEAALHVHGCVPSEALLVGDSATDIAAAHAAGMPCVGVAVGQERAAALITVGADGVVGDLGAFL